MKYTSTKIHNPQNSGNTSDNVAPVLFIFTKPSIPYDEGNNLPNHTQYSGIADFGHDIPDININGTDVNTNIKNGISRSRLKNDIAIAKNAHASKNGNKNNMISPRSPICVIPNNRGTIKNTQYPITK